VAFSMSIDQRADTTMISVKGEIDLMRAQQLESQISDTLDAPSKTVEVDLSGVTFMDSSGISALLKGRRHADLRGKSYRVTGAAGIVREVLELTGVAAHLSSDA
jgi:anti-sigma B factor antagonist